MISIQNSTTNIPNHTFCPYNPNRSIVMRITNMVTFLMKDAFEINDLAPFNVLYDVQHGTPEQKGKFIFPLSMSTGLKLFFSILMNYAIC